MNVTMFLPVLALPLLLGACAGGQANVADLNTTDTQAEHVRLVFHSLPLDLDSALRNERATETGM